VIAMFCSSLCRKTSVALISTYSIILLLYILPMTAISLFKILQIDAPAEAWLTVTSPFAAVFAVPLDANLTPDGEGPAYVGNLPLVIGYGVVTIGLVAVMLAAITLRLRARYRLAQ